MKSSHIKTPVLLYKYNIVHIKNKQKKNMPFFKFTVKETCKGDVFVFNKTLKSYTRCRT